VDVYAVEERAGDAPDVTLNLRGRAATFSGRVIPKTTRASPRCLFATWNSGRKSLNLRHILLN